MDCASARIGAGDGQPAEQDGEDQNEDGAQHQSGNREAGEADDGERLVKPAAAAYGGQDARGHRQGQAESQCGEGERQRVRIARGDQVGHRIMEADGAAQVAVQNAGPVVDVLRAQRQIESVLMAQRGQVRGRGAVAQHLQDGIAGDEMNEQEDQRDHQPDNRDGEHEAGEDRLHGLRTTINQLSGAGIGTGTRDWGPGTEGASRMTGWVGRPSAMGRATDTPPE